ncbi:two-component system histidine kinase PnpS [Paramaledivibacter caminithermalis]|jgi:two-component system phosphate regulon sensor histidine kinase PhoR|uniref:histidine kinase n=1 Tax=Paramaledivibacter caminithermalis (strain DSM 15212 / CIP 107654 / DViRD3) TaxID=1121301 RepID=A0A1M6PRT5_PARC5|nr:ATP-binding protein [Paramaledivibacter caminithermalis]SHK10709.1 PAS/PAC sensor signal transduction histidine kinase [Paramaledivibacter caminithermalis DSM 15212]
MKKKIFATYAVLLLMATILTGLLSLSFIRISYLDNIENMLITNGNLINSLVEDKLDDKIFSQIDFTSLAYKFSDKINARITFIDIYGDVIGDSMIEKKDLSKIQNHLYRPEIHKALNGEIGKSERFSTTTKIDYLYVAVPMKKDGIVYGVTRLAYPLNAINKINFGLIRNIIISVIIGLLIAIPLGYRYLNHITEPIKEITNIARKIANGNFNSRVNVKSRDEIKILADTFNFMSHTINTNISELQDKNTKLKSIIGSMKEGLIAVDNHKNIILINSPAKKLFNINLEDVLGKGVLNLIKNEKLKYNLEDMLNKNTSSKMEITLKEPSTRILKIYTELIKLNNDPNRIIGTLILILDVTEVRKLEEMRTDFVANVSHELKTPLTSIMGFIETLKNGAINNEKVRDRFLNIIEIETERLTRLIDDLLTLSDIESNGIGVAKKVNIKIKDVISEVSHMAEELARQKNIKYSHEVEENLPYVYGSRDWFKQLVLNLIENAIKYTPEGGEVKILAHKRENNIIINVKDTGIGIPKKDIPRLFERFYRVDKARSRKVGGTGLGLAIVKHIVISFGGEIRVKSEEGRGSEFIVRIPL